jgi:6-phosphogluconolactonase
MAETIRIYVGTYTTGDSKGIYLCEMDMETGMLTCLDHTSGAVNPSFLELDPQGRRLYAVSEIGDWNGEETGGVYAYAIDPGTGKLTYLNAQSSEGQGPCHVSVHESGRYVLVANYVEGSVAALPVLSDGSLGKATAAVRHEGSSVNPERQTKPYAHMIITDPQSRHVYVPDLGTDKIMIYRLDLEKGTLLPNDPPSASVTPGSGPRHLVFHPALPFAYLINEMGSVITVFSHDAASGGLETIQNISTLPPDFHGVNHTADIHITGSGQYLYGSNRGHDSLTMFRIDQRSGMLWLIGHESTQGDTPRNFYIDPTDTFLLAANMRSDAIVTFRIDHKTGRLISTGHSVRIPAPVCLKSAPVK